jgi:ketosteroid isomerase-like protein
VTDSPSETPVKSLAASPAATASATTNSSSAARTEAVVRALMAAWNGAWSAHKDRGALSTLFADDVQYYDAYQVGTVFTKSDINGMIQDPDWWKSLRLTQKSYFVSTDGRFAATLSRFATRDKSGKLLWRPGASVLAVGNDRITWDYDYYGGEQGKATQTEPMLAIPARAVAQESTAAQADVAAVTATLEKWLAAYNGRDASTFLSVYSANAKYVDVVGPKWRVMTKSQLAADVASRFPRSAFASKLEPEPGSPMDAAFFVSADGRFAAVQGTYADEIAGGRLVDQPMLVILKLRAGQIVQQYNFVAMDRSLLRS